MKVSPADIAFSKCVRERTAYTCEKCGSVHDPSSTGLHCSHVFSRRHRTIRWCGDNAQALCFMCHNWYGGNPAESGPWVRELLGEGLIEMLSEKRYERTKVTKLDEKAIAKHYREQLKKMQEQRTAGITGRLEFESYQ